MLPTTDVLRSRVQPAAPYAATFGKACVTIVACMVCAGCIRHACGALGRLEKVRSMLIF